MKKLLVILFFLSPFFSEGQTSVYHPFPEDSAMWCAAWCDGGIFMSSGATWQLDGKVLINGNSYSRLLHYETLGDWITFCVPTSTFYDSTTFYIRQDSVQKKVWRYWPPTNSDTLFLDFNVAIGDTLHFLDDSWTYIVNSIDSIFINSQYRRRYILSNPGCDLSMVEGIGPLCGLTYAPSNNNCFERFCRLTYFEQNGQTAYVDSSFHYIMCHDFALNIERVNFNSFTISPNPAHNILNVQCTLPYAELKIYDMTGREVMGEKIHSPLFTFNFQLSGGVYLVKVSDGERMAVEKLVVE